LIGDRLGYFSQVFFCREWLFQVYCAMERLEVLGWHGLSQHGGNGLWMVMDQGLGMEKAVNEHCLHGYILVLVWGELEGKQVVGGGPLQSGGHGGKRFKVHKRGVKQGSGYGWGMV
jgi:hypothetical protein